MILGVYLSTINAISWWLYFNTISCTEISNNRDAHEVDKTKKWYWAEELFKFRSE